jgi:hypothetical protein
MSSALYGEDAGDCRRLQGRFGRDQLCAVKMCDARRGVHGWSETIDMDQSLGAGCLKPVLRCFWIYCVLFAACCELRGKVGGMPAADLKAIAEFFDLFGRLF